MNIPHYRLYYWKNGLTLKVPKYFRFKYKSAQEAIDDIELYWKLNKGKKILFKQFLLVYWEEAYKDKIEKLITYEDV